MNFNKINTYILLWNIVIIKLPYEYIIEADIEKLWMDNNKQFSEEQAISYVKQILKGMQDLHQCYIMHQDKKHSLTQ
ncbi:unnamed protein product [Paramecium sonneborni]|uniref:Protein kinase domain-containing protein n=1 Tax=Paramecium sonneborni TaxID=65129 RepID=A0A8S1N5C1_9CILI|nr:unnamed protein product [Paramecium sonneborni]